MLDDMDKQFDEETHGKSVLEFNRFSSFEEISRSYMCEKYEEKDSSWFENPMGSWITHKCGKDDIKLILQVRKSGAISVLRALYKQNKNIAEADVSRILESIGKPNMVINRGDDRVSRAWGQWGKYDDNNSKRYPQYYFSVDLTEVGSDKDRYSIRKTLVNNEKVKEHITFNREVLWEGAWSILRWLGYFLIWWLVIKYQSEKLEEEDMQRPRWIIRRDRFFTLVKIVMGCGVATLVIGQGGETCSSRDMFGCSEYSGEYIDPWSGDQKWKYFVEILGVTLIAWIMALKGYKIERPTLSFWK